MTLVNSYFKRGFKLLTRFILLEVVGSIVLELFVKGVFVVLVRGQVFGRMGTFCRMQYIYGIRFYVFLCFQQVNKCRGLGVKGQKQGIFSDLLGFCIFRFFIVGFYAVRDFYFLKGYFFIRGYIKGFNELYCCFLGSWVFQVYEFLGKKNDL